MEVPLIYLINHIEAPCQNLLKEIVLLLQNVDESMTDDDLIQSLTKLLEERGVKMNSSHAKIEQNHAYRCIANQDVLDFIAKCPETANAEVLKVISDVGPYKIFLTPDNYIITDLDKYMANKSDRYLITSNFFECIYAIIYNSPIVGSKIVNKFFSYLESIGWPIGLLKPMISQIKQ